MFKNYFATAVRQALRHKLYSFINVLGLGIGLAACMLIFTYVQDELSFDQFHKDADRIYRITETFKTGDGTVTTALTPHRLAADLNSYFPEIEAVSRLDYDIASSLVEYGDKKLLQENISAADPGFFGFFSFDLLQGDKAEVLKEPYTVVISKAKAQQYFGRENPLGKTLKFIDPYNYTSYPVKVTGVFQDMPENSHFRKDFLLSAATADILEPERKESLGWTSHFSYLKLREGTNVPALEKKINQWIFGHYPPEITSWWSAFPLQKLGDIRLLSQLKEEAGVNGDIIYVRIFSIVAIIILLLACINYTNLATARAVNRAREIGVRRASGASKSQIMSQVFIESIFTVMVAYMLAVVIAILAIPYINALSGKNMMLGWMDSNQLIFLGVTLITGIIAGIYPAMFLAAYEPTRVLKGVVEKVGNRSLTFRKSLVIVQFSVSIVLLIGTFVIYSQWSYLRDKKLGIDSDQLMVLPVKSYKQDVSLSLLKEELLRYPEVRGVSATELGLAGRFDNYEVVKYNGKEFVIPRAIVEHDFFKALGVGMLSGPGFPSNIGKGFTDVVLNEAAAKFLGLKKVGDIIAIDSQKRRVVGVVQNFHFESLRSGLSPVIFMTRDIGFNYTLVKLKTGDMTSSIAKLKAVYKKIDPDAAFDYTFLDDKIINLYQSEATFFKLFLIFSGLAIFIACLGVMGLASFVTAQRTREIGIRKVLGASVNHISMLLTKDFFVQGIIAFAIASPLGYLLAVQWLNDFAYRVELSWWMFAASGISMLSLSLCVVSFQTIKAAMADPVENLRND